MAVPDSGVAFGHGTDFEDVTRRGRQERRRESEMQEKRGMIGDLKEGRTSAVSQTEALKF